MVGVDAAGPGEQVDLLLVGHGRRGQAGRQVQLPQAGAITSIQSVQIAAVDGKHRRTVERRRECGAERIPDAYSPDEPAGFGVKQGDDAAARLGEDLLPRVLDADDTVAPSLHRQQDSPGDFEVEPIQHLASGDGGFGVDLFPFLCRRGLRRQHKRQGRNQPRLHGKPPRRPCGTDLKSVLQRLSADSPSTLPRHSRAEQSPHLRVTVRLLTIPSYAPQKRPILPSPRYSGERGRG